MKAHVIMHIARLTGVLNLLLLVLALLSNQHIRAVSALSLKQNRRNLLEERAPHLSRVRDVEQLGDMGDDEGCTESNFQQSDSDCSKATNIAQHAAQEAVHAYGTQQCAAAEVAHQVKQQLADKALIAAKAAEAALAGKQQMVDQLESELCESESALQQEKASIANTQSHVQAIFRTAQQTQHLLEALQSIVKLAEENLACARAAVNGGQHEMAEKASLIEAAQRRVDSLIKLLKQARAELDCIKKSTYKAICAAAEARQKVNKDRRHSRKRRKTPKRNTDELH